MTNICKVVAEVSCFHLGQMDRARKLIDLAKWAGAHYVKFQKRNPEECVPNQMKHIPHPNANFAYGDTYIEHRQNLEFTIDKHRELKDYCDTIGIRYSSSVWDMTSAREIISLNPDYIKVPSACNTNYDLLKVLFEEYNGNVHISTGMITSDEILDLFDFLSKNDYLRRTVIYHCTSEYPCSFERLYLLQIEYFKELLSYYKSNAEIGFSDHGYGIASSVVASVLGATWVERHFVDDRTLRHTDASSALEPIGLYKLCRDLKNISKAMYYKEYVTKEEMLHRAKLKVSLD